MADVFGSESNKLIGRRQVLIGVGASAMAGAAIVDCSAEEVGSSVERSAALVADSMKAIHGGTWNIQINHKSKFVSISQDFT